MSRDGSETPPDDDRSKRSTMLFKIIVDVFQVIGIFLSVYSAWLLNLSPWGQVLIIVGGAVLVIAVSMIAIYGSPVPKGFLKKLGPVIAKARFGMPGVALVLVGVFYVADVRWPPAIFGASCPEPVDLRIVTGTENVVPLNDAAHRYLADRSENGCRAATISVTGDSSADELTYGFANGWASPGSGLGAEACGPVPSRVTLLGPRPDIWIPDSTEIAEMVRRNVQNQGGGVCAGRGDPIRTHADLTIQGPVASSPVVLAVFTRADRTTLGGSPEAAGQQTLTALLGNLRTNQVLDSVMRPSPDTAEPGLLSTPVLYQALRDSGWLTGATKQPEKLLGQSGISAGDITSVLCRFRDEDAASAPPPDSTAVVLPENAVARYDNGDPLEQQSPCRAGKPPSGNWRLYPFYTADLPVMQYPFVHVRWQGEDTDRRNRAVEDFRNWLRSDRLTGDGFRTTTGQSTDDRRLTGLGIAGNTVPALMPYHALRGDPGCVPSPDRVLACYTGALPPTQVSLLLDVSGSMGTPLPTGGPRLARAQQLAQRIVASVRPDTPISLFASFQDPGPTTQQVALSTNLAAREDMLTAIQRQVPRGIDLPLTDAVGQTAAKLQRGTQTLVLLTDGQRGGHISGARALAQRLKSQNPGLRVLTVLTGPLHCGDQPVASLVDAFGKSTCFDDQNATVENLADKITLSILWG